MIILRKKQFSGDDGFGGKKGKILRTKFRKLDSYKPFGPWEVHLTENAEDEYMEFDVKDRNIISKILEKLKTKPYSGNYGQHPLWEFYDKDNECVVWSAKINDKDRLNYLIFKTQNYILVTNLIGHTIIENSYANRPKLS
jgi:Txe/YoeB family toxin of Txe-Axe toxin-antitoxin module